MGPWQRGILGFIKIDSRQNDRSLGANSAQGGIPNVDKVFHKIDTVPGYYHAGGISLSGKVLAVALTNDTRPPTPPHNNNPETMIAFYRIPSDKNGRITEDTIKTMKETDELVPARIIRQKAPGSNSGAVAITRFPKGKFEGRYLVANSAYGYVGPIDLYMSKTTDINQGFEHLRRLEFKDMVEPLEPPVAEGLDFLVQNDGDIFLTALTSGQYRLFKVTGDIDIPKSVNLTYITKLHIKELPGSVRKEDNLIGEVYRVVKGFGGATGFGIYTDPSSRKLALYSVGSWTGRLDRDGNFRPP